MRSLLKATVLFASGHRSMDCMVRDISDAGARLVFGTMPAVPDHFELHIPSRGSLQTCVAVWRHEDTIGVRFVARDLLADNLTLAERLKALEAQNLRLKRRVVENPWATE